MVNAMFGKAENYAKRENVGMSERWNAIWGLIFVIAMRTVILTTGRLP
jgi:hypothetical protein